MQEEQAFAVHIDQHLAYLFGIAYNLMGNSADAEDAVQESVCKFLEKRPPLLSAEKVRPYLARTVAHHCLDLLRQQSRHRIRRLAENEVDALAATPIVSDKPDIDSWLARLPAKDRLVLDLFYREEMSLEEIAEVAGDSPGAVKVRLHRARQALRHMAVNDVTENGGDDCGRE